MRRLTILATLACCLLAPAAARADTNIADVLGPTKVSAYGGRLIWSAFNPANQENRLMTRLGDGPVETVPIPPTPTPFEADLGPGPDGHVVAVYPRCEPGCDIFSFDFTTGSEAKVPGGGAAARGGRGDRGLADPALAGVEDRARGHRRGSAV